MFKSQAAIVVTVLLIGNPAGFAQSSLSFPSKPQRQSSQHSSAEEHVASLLEARGLEPAAARQKSKTLFAATGGNRDAQLEFVRKRLGTHIESRSFDDALTRRALFERPLNLACAASLGAFFHDASGRLPGESEQKLLRDTAAMNRSLQAAV